MDRSKNDYNKLQKQYNVLYSENENNIKENDTLRTMRQENEAEIQDLNSEVSELSNQVITIYFNLFAWIQFHLYFIYIRLKTLKMNGN